MTAPNAKVGIVGLGRLGKRHAENLTFRVPGAEVVAACSPDADERAWATQHLGIAPTVNPAAYLPYTAARQFATLQHLSGNRLALNVVTDTGSARHFGGEPRQGE